MINRPLGQFNKEKPIALKAGDKRVLINGSTAKVDFRIVSEDYYQLLNNKISQLKKQVEIATKELWK